MTHASHSGAAVLFLKKNDPQRLVEKANRARDARHWKKAQEAFEKYLAQVPSNGPIWVQLGHCFKESGNFTEAEVAYARAEALMPGDADLQLQIGHLNKLAGNGAAASAAYKRCLALDAQNGDARYELEKLGERNVGANHPLHDLRHDSSFVHPERDRAANRREAAVEPERVARSAEAIAALYRKLPSPFPEDERDLVPKMLHFVFGFKEKGDIPYYGAMAIISALHFNPGWKAFYYTMHEPSGPNWLRVRHKVRLIIIDDFEFFGDARLHHYAHKADIVRLIILTGVGGAYLDVDTITRKSFEDLRNCDFVMGVQAAGANSASGLCNAVMLGKPKAAFSMHWLAQYDHFRSRGRDDLWDYHSVKMPVVLAAERPEIVTILDYRAFFYPLWNSVQRALFSETSGQYAADLEPAYCFHLWNGATGEWLDNIDDAFVQTSASIYADIARQAIGVESREASPPEEDLQVNGSAARQPGEGLYATTTRVAK